MTEASRRRRWARAAVVPVVASALDTVLFSAVGSPENAVSLARIPDPSLWLVAASALPPVVLLLLRHRYALAVCLGLAAYSAAVTLTIGSRPLVTLLIALFTVAATSPVTQSWVGLGGAFGAHGVTVAYEVSIEDVSAATVVAVATVFALFDLAAWSFGIRAFRARQRELRLVATREQLAAEAVSAERLRIARELHDIVANAVTIIVLQAAGVRPSTRTHPERVEKALDTIEQMATQAVSELQRLLTVLRAVTDEPEGATPGPGRLANLEALGRELQAADVTVTLTVDGTTHELDPSIDLTAYRVIQESLTNVRRHAGPGAAASVDLVVTDTRLSVRVRNNAGGALRPAVASLSSGFGLIGLAERVKLLGGEFWSGRQSDGGWLVRAELPVRQPAESDGEPDAARDAMR